MKNNTKRFLSLALAGTVISGVPVVSVANDEVAGTIQTQESAREFNYIVKEGDTLGKIAEAFFGSAAYYELLAKYNNLDDPSLIFPGDVIVIPETLLELLNVEYDVNTQEELVENNWEADKTYTVKEGDTLYCIVNVQYGLKNQEAVDKLATYNNLGDPNRIVRGQVLLIPCVEKLLQVVQNDYSEEYNRMGWILTLQDGCHDEKPVCPPPFTFEHHCEMPLPCEPVFVHPCEVPPIHMEKGPKRVLKP